jgi:hypothetical protein
VTAFVELFKEHIVKGRVEMVFPHSARAGVGFREGAPSDRLITQVVAPQ